MWLCSLEKDAGGSGGSRGRGGEDHGMQSESREVREEEMGEVKRKHVSGVVGRGLEHISHLFSTTL